LTRPSKRTIPMATIPMIDEEEIITYDASMADSALWRPDIRRQVQERKLTIADIYILQGANLVPGTPLELGKFTSHVPIIMCQHPGGGQGRDECDNACWAAGIDILLPRGWGKDFWLSLIYNGARAGGLKEVAAANFENGLLTFPRFFPDSGVGEAEAKVAEAEAVEKYFARPIAKRVNFLCMGTHFPFRTPWSTLVKEWRESGIQNGEKVNGSAGEDSRKDFHVMRDRNSLKKIAESLLPSAGNRTSFNSFSSLQNSLVPIRVTCESKGTILPFSLLCAPLEEDVKNYRRCMQKGEIWTPPEEPVHWVSDEHQTHLRKAVKKGGKELGVARFPIAVDSPDAVRSVCSRLTMGFVVEGNLALTRGKPRGVGFIAGSAMTHLVDLFTRSRVAENNNNFSSAAAANLPFLLCRCPNSRQYRKVEFEILR